MATIPPDDPSRTPGPGGSTAASPSGSGTQAGDRDAPPLARPAALAPTIPGYAVSGEVARGGMGVILAARELALDREVAIKVLLPGAAAVLARRFVTESRITARLPHPGIPPVYALGEAPDGTPFLAMKLIRGRTLADLLRERPDPAADLPRFVAVFEQVCQAVAFAHAQRIVHRDLKPANVMVGAFGEVQVMDWGLAKQLGGSGVAGPAEERTATACTSGAGRPGTAAPGGGPDERTATVPPSDPPGGDVTQAGAVLGTPAYMAPEQARGEPVDCRADVFALGGVLCAILTGGPPFAGGDSRLPLALAAAGDVSAALRRLAACGADAELVALAGRCLSPAPAGRPPDAAAVAAAVAAYRAGVEGRLRRAEAERAAAEAREAEQRKRRRVQLLLAGAVGLIGLGAGAFAWWHDRQAERARTREAVVEGERKAERAELAAEQRVKAEQTRLGIGQVFAAAADLRRQYRFADADRVLEYGLHVTRVAGLDDLRAEVERARADLAFARELDEICYGKWTWLPGPGGAGRFDLEGAPPRYHRAFLARGLDPRSGDPAAVAERLRASGVRAEAVAALDDWAMWEPDRAAKGRLLEVARLADPGPWTDRFRTPAAWRDRAALERLARELDPATAPPAAVEVLGFLLMAHGADPVAPLRAAQARRPGEFRLAFALGQALQRRDSPRQAEFFRAALALRPDNPAVGLNLGHALERSGDPAGAVECLEQVVRLRPDFAYAHNNLGLALGRLGEFDRAIASYREAIRLDPTDPLPHANLGAALGRKGRTDEAIAALREAIRLRPGSASAHSDLGAVLLEAGRHGEAIAVLREAIRLDAKEANAHANLGAALRRTGDLRGAEAAFREAVRAGPKTARFHDELGTVLAATGRMDEAIECFRTAARLDPRSAAARINLAAAYLDRGDWAAAAAAGREAVRLDPADPFGHCNLGLALARLGDWDGAAAALREGLRLDPNLAPAREALQTVLRGKAERDARTAPPPREVRR